MVDQMDVQQVACLASHWVEKSDLIEVVCWALHLVEVLDEHLAVHLDDLQAAWKADHWAVRMDGVTVCMLM